MNKYTYTVVIMSILALSVGIAVGQDISAGKTVFDSKCGSCHMMKGTGVGPNMTVLSGDTASDIMQTVRNGVSTSTPQMPKFDSTMISDTDLNNVIAYIQSNASSSTTYAPTPMPPLTTSYPTATSSYPMTNISNATNATPSMTTPAMMNVTPIMTTPFEETTVATPMLTSTPEIPVATATPKAPGFGIFLGIVGILLIYWLRHR